MENPAQIKKIKMLGKFCNVSSIIFTILLCLPMPIIYFFLKNTKKYFSILDGFEKYLRNEINIETLKKRINNVFIRLGVITLIFFFITWLLFTENNTDDFEMRGNFIFTFTFLILLLPCYFLCFKVNEYLRDN